MYKRQVYNSINGFSTPEELEQLAELPICASVVQAYNPGSKKPDGPYRTLIGKKGKEGFLEKARKAGMTKLLIDIPTLDLSNIGTIPAAAAVIRDELGLPAGTAPSNATYALSLIHISAASAITLRIRRLWAAFWPWWYGRVRLCSISLL